MSRRPCSTDETRNLVTGRSESPKDIRMKNMAEMGYRLEQTVLLADRLQARRADLQEAAALDAGFPARITRMEVDLSVEHLRTMAEEIPWVEKRKPFGTVAAIFPYDAPAVMLARMGGAALLTGNRLRFSFSSLTPRCAIVLSEICGPVEGLEPIAEMDNREFGEECVRDTSVRVLFMSGASAVGEAYRSHADAFDKLFFAGPGGMPAAVVFEDADPAAASRFIARRAFINGGQYCTTLKKALIHQSLYEQVREHVLTSAENLRVGDPMDPQTAVGPIRVARTRRILEKALEKCPYAHRLSGEIHGETVRPFVLEVESGDPIPDMELFGPFLLLKPFQEADRAIEEVVRTRYGFLLAFFGSVRQDTRAIFNDHFGMVHDNPDFLFTPLRIPFGGKKESGWIMEKRGGRWALRDGAFLYSRELTRSD